MFTSIRIPGWLGAMLLLGAVPASNAASLYVTSDATPDPMATSCTLGAPCHIDDALRIAEGNGADDQMILVGPSSFIGSNYISYYPNASDLDRDFAIRVDGGSGLFDGNGGALSIALRSRAGDLSISGIEVRNSQDSYNTTVPNDPIRISSDSGDILLDDVTVWNNTRTTVGAQNDGSAGAHLITGTGDIEVRDSLFFNNMPGALHLEARHANLNGNSFLANLSQPSGSSQGAVRIDASVIDVSGNNFSGNRCDGAGFAGAMSVYFNPAIPGGTVNSRIVGNQFLNNSGRQCSGALYLDRPGDTIGTTFISEIALDGNLIARNQASDAPGAGIYAYLQRQTRLLMRNNQLFDNETTNGPFSGISDGSALYALLRKDAELHLINNTVTGNRMAATSGSSGAVHIDTGHYDNVVALFNNVIWDNPTAVNVQDDSDLFLSGDINADVTVRFNDYGAWLFYGGSGSATLSVSNNLSSTPGFVDAANDDYHLDAASNLIDQGSTLSTHLPSVDMDGQSRVQLITVDMGADEFSGVARRLLTISKVGSGDGSVSSVPSGLNCAVGCSSNASRFDDGSTIGLLAVADNDSEFVGWGGDCAGSDPGTQITVNADRSCTAEFQPRQYRIVIDAAGPESGSIGSSFGPALNWFYPVGGDQRVIDNIPPGSSVTITGTVSDPLMGHVFLDDCESQGGAVSGQATSEATCTFSSMQQDHRITVNFNSGIVLFPGRQLSITRSGAGSGTVTSTPAGISCGTTCMHDFFYNTDVTLTPLADANSLFAGWVGDCPSGAGDVVIRMDAAKSCDALFMLARQVDIAMSGNGSGNLSDVYRASGYRYPQWGSQYSGSYPDSAGLQFQFNGDDSTVSISGCDDSGQGIVLTGNGTGNASCSIGNINSDVSLSVTYSANSAVLTVNASGSGSGVVTTNQGGIGYSYPAVNSGQTSPITHGNNVLISATGANGSTVHWSGCSGAGARVINEGTANSSCQIGIYQATTVDVEFRATTPPASVIFADGFE